MSSLGKDDSDQENTWIPCLEAGNCEVGLGRFSAKTRLSTINRNWSSIPQNCFQSDPNFGLPIENWIINSTCDLTNVSKYHEIAYCPSTLPVCYNNIFWQPPVLTLAHLLIQRGIGRRFYRFWRHRHQRHYQHLFWRHGLQSFVMTMPKEMS